MIEIYGNERCVYCIKAKRLAANFGMHYDWFDVDLSENLNTLKQRLPDCKTIPQIWWHGRHIGGYTEFAAEVENTSGGYGDGKL